MNFPSELKYTAEHEWIKLLDDNTAIVGITDFAQGELGDIVFVEIETLDAELTGSDIFGTVEAVKTVSDLFMPINGTVIEVNPALVDNPELVNSDPYGEGWMIKMTIADNTQIAELLDVEAYKNLVGN